MKRRWFGVVLALFSSISSLLLAAPAYAQTGSAGCPVFKDCVILVVTLSQPVSGATVTAHRNAPAYYGNSPTPIDDTFDLQPVAGSSTQYTSIRPVYGTSAQDNACRNGGSNTATATFTITATGGGISPTATTQQLLCSTNANATNQQVNVNLTVATASNNSGKGGISGSAYFGPDPCKNDGVQNFSTIKIDGQLINTDASGGFNTGLAFTPGDKSVDVACFVGGQPHNYTVTTNAAGTKITVVAGQIVGVGELTNPADPNANAAPTTCHSDNGFSWLICGAITAMLGVVDGIRDNIIVPFLKEPAFDKSLPEFSTAYSIWSSFRNVASIFFILVFFLVIIGTAAGFDNYTIKKVLPHLVAGAILMPFSWYFCAFIIDIGNVLGQGIHVLVSNMIPPNSNNIDLTTNFSALFLGAGTAAALFGLYGAAATIGLGVVISILLAFAGVFLTLVLRKIFILICVIISPFAILAWVLPNTSKWFKEWWQNLFKLVMMYPIVILLFEAGRIFSASAGAAVGTATPGTNWVIPALQIMGLVLPLFAVPFAFRFAGKGLAAGNKAVERFTGGLDKRYGKDSASAKTAAANREFRNMQRGKNLDTRIANATGVEKARLIAAQRMAYRRAGHATPWNKKQSGFMSNPTRLLEQEAAYGKVMGQQGILDANDKNKQDGVPGESHQQRREAEGLLAQQKKLNDRANRLGMVKNAQDLGPQALAEHNRALVESGVLQTQESQAEKGGAAIKRIQEAARQPLTSHEIADHAGKLQEVAEAERRKVIKDEISMSDTLDQKAMDDANAALPPGQHISIQRAHEMRIQNLARAAGIGAENKMIGKEIEATATTTASDKLTNEEMRRAAAAGHPITREQAMMNRLGQGMKAGIGRNVEHRIAEEAKDYAYNEMEHEAGGPLSTETIVAGTRLLERQRLADDRTKLEGAVIAGTNPDGSDKVSSAEILTASRYNATKAFGDSQGTVQGTLDAMKKEAELNHIDINGPGGVSQALVAAGERSTAASAITKGKQLTRAVGQQEGVIKGEDRAIKRAQAQARAAGNAVPTAAQVRSRQLSNARTAAVVTATRAATTEYAQDQAVMNDLAANPVTQAQVYESALQGATDEVSARTGRIIAGANAAAAAARTAGLVPGSRAAGIQAARESGESTRIKQEEALGKGVGEKRGTIDRDRKNPVTPEQYIATSRDQTGRSGMKQAAETVGAANQLESDIQAELDTNGGTRESAEAAVRDRRLENVKTSGLLNGEVNAAAAVETEAGDAKGVDTAINNEIDAQSKDTFGPALPPAQAHARPAARAEARKALVKASGKEARIGAVEKRVAALRKAKGASSTFEAAVDIARDEALVSKMREDKVNQTRQEEMRDFDNRVEDKVRQNISREDAEAAVRDEIETTAKQEGDAEADRVRKGLSEGTITAPNDRDAAEETLFTAAGDSAEEAASREEETTQGRRLAQSDAFRSTKKTSHRKRIEGYVRSNTDALAEESAKSKVREDQKPRAFDDAMQAALNVQEQRLMRERSEEASKLRFSDLGRDYQEVLEEVGNGTNPFGNLPIGEVDQNAVGNQGLQAIVRQAIKNKDWHIAQAAMEHLVETNGGFDIAKDIQYDSVENGGFGGGPWDQVDAANKDASMLKYVWEQSIDKVAKKSNMDANKPIAVAAKGWKPEKLSGVNDKLMGRILKFYHTEPQRLQAELTDAQNALQDLTNRGVNPSSQEFKRAEARVKDLNGRKNIVDNAMKDFENTTRDLLRHPTLAFDTDALRVLVSDSTSANPIIQDPAIQADLASKLG